MSEDNDDLLMQPETAAELLRLLRIIRRLTIKARRIILNPPGTTENAREFRAAWAAARLIELENEAVVVRAQLVKRTAKILGREFRSEVRRVDADLSAAVAKHPELLAKRDVITAATEAAGVIKPPVKGSFSLMDSRPGRALLRDSVRDIAQIPDQIVDRTRNVLGKLQGIDANKGDIDRLVNGMSPKEVAAPRRENRTPGPQGSSEDRSTPRQQIMAAGNLSEVPQAKISRVLATGVLSGKRDATIRELKAELKKIAKNGFVEVINKRGRPMRFTVNDYADIVFKSSIAASANIATTERLVSRGIDTVKIIGSNSARFCTAFVGKFFSITGKTPGLPLLRSLPNWARYSTMHVRCTKRAVAVILRLLTPAQLAAGQLSPAAVRMLNKAPSQAQTDYARQQAKEAKDGQKLAS